MNNPPPRPALSKAPDADLHPVSGTRIAPAVTSLRPVTGIGGGATSAPTVKGKEGKPVAVKMKLPADLHRAAKKVAKREGVSVNDVLVTAVESYLSSR